MSHSNNRILARASPVISNIFGRTFGKLSWSMIASSLAAGSKWIRFTSRTAAYFHAWSN
jgi:hypothetical protein